MKKLLSRWLGRRPRIALYTAIFGRRDELIEPTAFIRNADLFCFTDRPFRSAAYRVVPSELSVPGDPVRSSRRIKMVGHPDLAPYDFWIWVDGRLQLRFDDAAALVRDCLGGAELAMMAHPDGRDCVYEEADFLIRYNHIWNFDDPRLIADQVRRYREEGLPEHAGLVAGGFMVRNANSVRVRRIMRAWWEEVALRSRRDQLSFPYVIWKLRESHATIPGSFWDNRYFRTVDHTGPATP